MCGNGRAGVTDETLLSNMDLPILKWHFGTLKSLFGALKRDFGMAGISFADSFNGTFFYQSVLVVQPARQRRVITPLGAGNFF